MPEIVRFSNCKICMDDHHPPHFHIRGRGWDVSVDLRTLAVTRGSGLHGDIAEALQWATMNQATLYATWGKLNERE